jgi:Tfp pilus assembly protein PilN
MRLRTKTALGIDLGAGRVSVALVERDEQGFRTIAAASGAWPAREAGQQEVAPGKVLARLLSQLGRRAQVRRAPAAVALSADSAVMQLLDLPQHVPANIGEFVKGELQQYVALSGKNVISDFCGVGAGAPKRVLAVAADVDEIQERLQGCTAAGLAVDVVEPSALAYARAFLSRQGPSPGHGDALIALLGPHTLTIQLFLRGALDFIRIRSVPQDAGTVPALCDWLAEELRALTRYGATVGWGLPHRSPSGGASPTLHWRVVLLDGQYRADEIAARLTAEVGLESLTVAEAREPWSGADATKQEGVSLAAVGAALGLLETAGDHRKINLLPPTVVAARSLSRHVLATAIVGIVVFLCMFATAGLLARTTGAMDRRIEQTRLSEELYAAPALIAKEKFLDQEIARLGRRLGPLRKALAGRHQPDWPAILAAVRQAVPAEVSVAQWQCSDGRTLSLKGLTPSCRAAETFVQNLESQPPFEAVDLALVQKPQDAGDRLEYRIACILKAKMRVEGVGTPNAMNRVWEPVPPSQRGPEAHDTAQGGKSS